MLTSLIQAGRSPQIAQTDGEQLTIIITTLGVKGWLATDLVPGVALDLREFEFRVVGVHLADLVARGSAQHLDDLHQLVHARVSGEDGLSH